MPEFATPEPISVTVDLSVGYVRIDASDRTDTVVDVQPTNADDESDVKAAQQVRVEFADGTLTVTGPKSRAFDFSRKTRSVDLTISLPTGSRVAADVQLGDFRSTGRLGDTRFKTGAGNLRLAHTGTLHARTGAGHIDVERIGGDAEVSTGTGKIRLGDIDGAAVVKNSSSDTAIGAVSGDVRVRAANGDITVARAGAGADVKTSNGDVRIGEVVRGQVQLGTAAGDLEVGIAEGTAAWLQVTTAFGHVHNTLATAEEPAPTMQTVEVRGHTSFGDVTIRRA